jgi:hypothetical protein
LARPIRKTAKEGKEKTPLSEGRSVLKKEFDRADIVRDAIVMIFLYSIDQTRWLARVTLSGSVDGHQIAAAMEALYQDPAWAAEFDILWDALRCLLELRLVCSVKSQRTLPCFQPMTVCGKLFFNVLAHNFSGSRFVGLFVGTGTIGA